MAQSSHNSEIYNIGVHAREPQNHDNGASDIWALTAYSEHEKHRTQIMNIILLDSAINEYVFNRRLSEYLGSLLLLNLQYTGCYL